MRPPRNALLLVAVALAFADSAIVVLALPDLIDRFDASIGGVSWVVTSYNLALAITALALPPLLRRTEPATVVRAGATVFAAASLGCAASGELWLLVACRTVQGVGGALLLAASVPVLGGDRRATTRWALASAIGAAVGPAAGGALTQLFDWRAIFIVQAPVAALALAAPRVPAAAAVAAPPEPQSGARRRLAANTALALLSGALVGALFLVVVLLVDAWRYSPLAAAAAASALPVGTVAARLVRRSSPAAGAVFVAGGLAALAFIPDDAVGWPVAALALCGLGSGLALPPLTLAAFAGAARLDTAAARSVGARHVGLVLALVAITALLTAALDSGIERAKLLGTARVLDAPLPLETKVPLAVQLALALERVPKGEVPDFTPQFAPHPEAAALHRRLDETIVAVITHAFRGSFLLCAGLALVSLPLIGLARR